MLRFGPAAMCSFENWLVWVLAAVRCGKRLLGDAVGAELAHALSKLRLSMRLRVMLRGLAPCVFKVYGACCDGERCATVGLVLGVGWVFILVDSCPNWRVI